MRIHLNDIAGIGKFDNINIYFYIKNNFNVSQTF